MRHSDTSPPAEEEYLTIGQMRARFDVTARTLRFYEARKLLNPLRRGQHRLYDRRDCARLTLILRGKRFGFSLEEIRQLLDLYEPGVANTTQLRATIDTARQRLAAMERQQAELARAITDLRQQLAQAENCLGAMDDLATRTRDAGPAAPHASGNPKPSLTG